MIDPGLLATGLVIDSPDQGTTFPSAGGNSADPRVQAVYWRCVITLFASARINAPDLPLALFCNVAPPVIDGVAIGAVLDRYGVELRRVPLTARLGRERTAAWGNVLYFYDILGALSDEPNDLRLALVDSDVLVTAAPDALFARIGAQGMSGYVVDTAPDEPVNGMTRRSMAAAASDLAGRTFEPLPHFGGELFGSTMAAWRRHSGMFQTILDQALAQRGPAAGVLTEEHVFSIAFALIGSEVTTANDQIKRIWTSPRHNTARPGDEALPLWHLPAEKRYGLADLYHWLAQRGFPREIDPADFRHQAMALCAVPDKSIGKWLRDGRRQIAARLGAAA